MPCVILRTSQKPCLNKFNETNHFPTTPINSALLHVYISTYSASAKIKVEYPASANIKLFLFYLQTNLFFLILLAHLSCHSYRQAVIQIFTNEYYNEWHSS
jgi:hypothetical protein